MEIFKNHHYPTLLITGGAGFIGSNFLHHILNTNYNIVNLDLLTYAGNLDNLEEVSKNSKYHFIKGDICNLELVEYIFNTFDIKGVIHFAAESHVDNSILTPDLFIRTNILGTHTLLDISYKHWMIKPFEFKDGYKDCRFHHISTDEVYGTLGEEGFFTETTPYAPNSPYSASKASSDMIVRSYHHTYGLNTVITNCSNNYGFYQHKEKLIPTIIRKALRGEDIPIYGDGKNIRDWLYVEDHCRAIDLVFHKGKKGETYNIGSNNEKTNLEIANSICQILDKIKPSCKSYKEQIRFVEDRPGHDKRYAVDASKIKQDLNWESMVSFESGLEKTVLWYLEWGIW